MWIYKKVILPNSDPLIVHWRRLRLLWGLSGLKADICFIISHQKGTASEAAREGERAMAKAMRHNYVAPARALRGLQYMMSTLEGGGGSGKSRQKEPNQLIYVPDRGDKKIPTFCGRHLWKPPKFNI